MINLRFPIDSWTAKLVINIPKIIGWLMIGSFLVNHFGWNETAYLAVALLLMGFSVKFGEGTN